LLVARKLLARAAALSLSLCSVLGGAGAGLGAGRASPQRRARLDPRAALPHRGGSRGRRKPRSDESLQRLQFDAISLSPFFFLAPHTRTLRPSSWLLPGVGRGRKPALPLLRAAAHLRRAAPRNRPRARLQPRAPNARRHDTS
jgi:hypothetical protein